MITDLKQLETLQSKIESKLEVVSKELFNLNKEKKDYEQQLKSIKSKIKSQLNTDITVSEHAIIRYFQRELGYNIDEIKNTICPLDVKDQLKVLRNCEYPVKDFKIVVRNNKILTVIKD